MPTNPPTPITHASSGAIHATATATTSRASSFLDALTEQELHEQFNAALYHAAKIVAGLHFGISPSEAMRIQSDASPREISVFSPNIDAYVYNAYPVSRTQGEENFRQTIIIEYAGRILTQDPEDYLLAEMEDEEALLARLRTNEWARARLLEKLIRQADELMRRPEYLRATYALAYELFATEGDLDPEGALATVREAIYRYHYEPGGKSLRRWFHQVAFGTKGKSLRWWFHGLAFETRSAMRVLLPNGPWARAQIHETLRPST